MAANVFTGATNNNWGTATNWSQGTVPTATDTHVTTFDGTSPNCTVNTSARVCNILDFTGYTNTITMSQQITVSGNVTLGASMIIAGSGGLVIGTTATMTSAGKAWPNNFTTTGTITLTVADNWDINGDFTTAGTVVFNGSTINWGASLTNTSSGTISGTTNFVMDGTGNLSTSTGSIRNNLTINTAGAITLGATLNYNTGTFTYTAGTVNYASNLFTSALTGTTFAANGITFDQITLSGASTVTLNENLNATGRVILGSTTSNLVVNGNAINCSGGLRQGGSTAAVTGTTVMNILATSTLDGLILTTGRLTNTVNINAPGGTITIDDTFNYQLDNLLLTAVGSVVTDAGTWTFGGHGNANILGGSVVA